MKKISKLEFIKQIVDLLRSEVDEKKLRLILKDYTLYFNHELELGKSEEDVLTFLYSPELFIETLHKYDLAETLKKLGQDDYNIFVELTKDYNYSTNSNTKHNKETSKEDANNKPSEDNKDNNIKDDKDNKDNINKNVNTSNSNNNVIDEKNTTNTTSTQTKSNTKKGIGYIINFLLGLILLVVFIPIVACGFVAGFMFITLSILFSSTISLLFGFLSTLSIIFIMLSSLCLLTFGIGTVCLNIQLIINYVKYFFLINSTNLEDTQNA